MNNLSPKEKLLKKYLESQDNQDWKMCGFLEWISFDWFGTDIESL